MRFSQLGKGKKVVAIVAVIVALGSAIYWLPGELGLGPSSVGDETGEFLLVEAADRALDGAPALALTFTLPLDPRKNYDNFARVFEMPAPATAATPVPRQVFDEDAPRGNTGSIVSTAPEDTDPQGGKPVSGAWVVGENPRLLFFPHIKPVTRYVVQVLPGLEARNGTKLASASSYSVKTAPVSPAYYFASNGMVLPARQNGGLPVVTVNVPEVDIQFLRVRAEKLSEFLDRVIPGARKPRAESSEEDGDGDGERVYEYDYNRTSLHGAVGNYQIDNLRGLTESVYLGRFTTEKTANKRSVTYISVEDIRELQEPGVYIAVMNEPGRFRYDYQATYFYVSDLGLHTRLFEKSADAFVSSLVDGGPARNVEVSFVDGQGKVLARAETDANGHAAFPERPQDAKVVMARKDKQVSLIALREPALDLSEYDVVGQQSKPVRLYAYSGRDLYRPGESFDVSVLSRDADGRSVPAQPVQAVLKNPAGRRQFTALWKPDARFNGYYLERVDLPADAPTGFWTLELRADPADKLAAAVFRFGVEEFLPERMKLDLTTEQPALEPDDTFEITTKGTYLYGAPASGNRLLRVVEFARNKSPLAKYPGFEFGDVFEDEVKVRRELEEQTLGGDGQASSEIELAPIEGKHSPFTVRATFSLLETGGRPVIRSIERVVWPATVMTGIRPLFTGAYVREGSRAEFEVLRSDADGNLKAGVSMPVRLFRENRDYYWRFDDQRGWHSGFTETDELVETSSVTVPSGGRGKILLPVKYGRYRIEILDRETDQTLKYRFYAGWSAQTDEAAGVRPDRVALKLDKPAYREGETARLTITPPHEGEALITVDGDRTLWVHRTKVSGDTATLDIPINRDWKRHDLYISVMVLRPGNAGDLVTPARALGVTHLPLERSARKLNVTLEAPQKVRPETPVKIKVRAPEARGERAVVTLSAVDAGILNITRFVSPDPFAYFFGKLRYGADQHDVYGRLIEKMQGRKGQLKFGGDSAAGAGKSLPKIVQLVDIFSGPVLLDAKGETEISFLAPDFNGMLRLMAVVSAADRFGAKDADMIVAAPLITELATPRFLSFGDNAVVALDLQNLSGNAQQLTVGVKGSGSVEVQDGQRTLSLKDQEKQTLRFPVAAGNNPGVHAITVSVNGQRLRIERNFPLAVRPPTPQMQFTRRFSAGPGETMEIRDPNLSGLHRNAALAHVVISNKPPIDVRGAVQGLLTYPYGCTEQTTSTAYPHVFIDEEEARRFGLKAFTRDQRAEMLERAVARLGAMQAPNGGFSLWGNVSEYEYWLSAYVTSFLMDAREQGFTVPDTMYRNATDFLLRGLQEGAAKLPTAATSNTGRFQDDAFWRDQNNGRFDALTYGALVLARERKAPLATLRQLHDSRDQAQSGLPLVQLGIALSLMGDNARGAVAISEGVRKGRGSLYWSYGYGSTLRDAALSYALLERHKIAADGRDNLLPIIAAELENSRYLSTQEKMALFLVGRSLATAGGPWTADLVAGGRTERLGRSGPQFRELTASELSAGLQIVNTTKSRLYAEVSLTGNTIQMPAPQFDPIELSRTYYTPDGTSIGGRPLTVGEVVLVHLTVRSRMDIPTGLVVDRIPAGLEIENLNIVKGEQMGAVTIGGINPAQAMNDSRIKHLEFRDDRFVAALRIDPTGTFNRFNDNNGVVNLFYRARVVTPGEFVMPPLYAEDMYRPNIFGLMGGGPNLTIVEPNTN